MIHDTQIFDLYKDYRGRNVFNNIRQGKTPCPSREQ